MSATPEEMAELIADALYPRLEAAFLERAENAAAPPELVTAAELARRYGRPARWWRQHAAEFGALRDSDGPKARLFFNAAKVERVLNGRG